MLKRIKEEQQRIRQEINEKTTGYILAALGLVAGLAWNEAIKSIIDTFFPIPGNDVVVKFAYAFIITAIIVVVTIYLARLTQKKEEEKK